MDPNANLAEQERLLTTAETVVGKVERLEALRESLYKWVFIRKGFEPDWTKAPNARKYYGR